MQVPHPSRLNPLKAALRVAICGAALALAPAWADNASAKVAPGDDFFTYVNADWLHSVQIPADRSSWSNGAEMMELNNQRLKAMIEAAAKGATGEAKKVSDYYNTALDEAAIEAKGLAPLQQVLAPIAAIKDKKQLTRVLGASLRVDVDPLNATNFFTENLFGLWIAQGFTDPTHNTPYLLQGGLGLPDRAYYLDQNARMAELRSKYQAHIAATFKLAGIDRAEERAARVFALETRIAETHGTREDSADVLKANNNWTAADFARNAPGMDWKLFLQSAGLGKQQKFIAYHPSAIKGAAALVASEPLDSWKDFLTFHTINHLHSAEPKALSEEHFNFYGRTLSGTPEQAARWKRSLAAIDSAMPDALGKMYVSKYFPASSKQYVQEMVSNIVAAFHQRIDQLDWMAPATRKEAHAKLDTLYVGVGYPEKWASYDGLKVVPGDAMGNLLRAEKFHTQQQLAKLNQPVDRTEWCMPAQLVNAVNMPMQNAINFPAAILQQPDFDPSYPDAINYGAIGAVIGHEISHSFDDQGAQFDSKGLLRDWWTKEDGEHFKNASAVLVAQYSAYKPFPDLALNGQQTLSENLADLAGLAAAYDAYKTKLHGKESPQADREFFSGYAQSWRIVMREPALRQRVLTDGHSPAQWRTYTVRNLDAWYKAFDVQPGQFLYLKPEERVRVW